MPGSPSLAAIQHAYDTKMAQAQNPQAPRLSDPNHQRAAAIHSTMDAAIERTRADGRLSAEGKRQRIAAAHVSGKQQLDALRDSVEAKRQADRQQAIRGAFGTPTDPLEAMSYRQALSQADGIEDANTASWKLQQANERGDSLLVRAIASRAADMQWSGVVNDYRTLVPSAGQALADYDAVEADSNPFSQHRAVGDMNYLTITPTELNGLSDTAISELAAQAQWNA